MNNQIALGLLLVLCLVTSCHHKVDADDELLIAEITLQEITGPDSVWRKRLMPKNLFLPPEVKPTTEQLNSFQKYRDSLRAELDTAKIYLIVSDSLTGVPEYAKERIENRMENEFFKRRPTLVPAFTKTVTALTNIKTRRVIDLSGLHAYDNIQYVRETNKEKFKGRASLIGNAQLSRAAISVNKKRACIFVAFQCGSLCGNGWLYFFEKREDQWILIFKEMLWVS